MSALNRVSLLKKVKNNIPEIMVFLAVLVITLLLSFKVNIFIGVVVGSLVGFVALRLFFGKLKLDPGDVVLFWGLPRSGKTMAQNVVANYNKKKYGFYIVGNEEFSETSKICDAVLPRQAFGHFRCPEFSIICTDEASLNGWDNRDWASNFTPKSLAYWKKIRHYKNAAILTNQGFGELDCKIRDSLISCIYYCEDHGRYSKCIRMDKSIQFSEETGLPVEGYTMPSIWQRLLDPSCVLYLWHTKAGQLYNTYNPDPLPLIDDMYKYEWHPDKRYKDKGYYALKKEYQSTASDTAS